MNDPTLAEYEKEQRADAAHKREMERLAAQERIEKVKADAEVKKVRSQNRPISVATIAAMLVILALVGAFTYGCTRPPDPGAPTQMDESQIEQKREADCIDAGGGWVPDDVVANSTQGMCVFPGNKDGE